jgi:predicted RNA-binding protein
MILMTIIITVTLLLGFAIHQLALTWRKVQENRDAHQLALARLRDEIDGNTHKRYLETQPVTMSEAELAMRTAEAEARRAEAETKKMQASAEYERAKRSRY